MIRDTVLAASGQLSPKIGGPSVFPVQPSGITEASYGPLTWTVSQGEDRYRRGLYTFSKRTTPYAAFMLYDAPSGETCIARRDRSNTPLQALNMLNDPVVLEAAQVMARTAMCAAALPPSATDQQQQVDAAAAGDEVCAVSLFRRCVTRPPRPAELAAVLDYYHRQRHRYVSRQCNPLPIIGGGEVRQWSFVHDADGWTGRHQCTLRRAMDDYRLQVPAKIRSWVRRSRGQKVTTA